MKHRLTDTLPAGTCNDKGVGVESVIAQLNELLSTAPNGKQSTIYYTGVGTGFSTVGKAWGGKASFDQNLRELSAQGPSLTCSRNI
jgi:hypothetical protein